MGNCHFANFQLSKAGFQKTLGWTQTSQIPMITSLANQVYLEFLLEDLESGRCNISFMYHHNIQKKKKMWKIVETFKYTAKLSFECLMTLL